MTQNPLQPQLRDRLLGTWHLTTCELRSVTGETWYPYGPHPKGMLMYDPAGHVIVVLMRPGRPAFASSDLLTGTLEEIREAFLGFDAYCGTFSVDEAQSTLTDHITACRFPLGRAWTSSGSSSLTRRACISDPCPTPSGTPHGPWRRAGNKPPERTGWWTCHTFLACM